MFLNLDLFPVRSSVSPYSDLVPVRILFSVFYRIIPTVLYLVFIHVFCIFKIENMSGASARGSGFVMSMTNFDKMFAEQHPDAFISRWLELPEEQPFRLTNIVFGKSIWVDNNTGEHPDTCILSLENENGELKRVWSCKSLIELLRKEEPLRFDTKAYFIVNKGVLTLSRNRTFHRSALVSTNLSDTNFERPFIVPSLESELMSTDIPSHNPIEKRKQDVPNDKRESKIKKRKLVNETNTSNTVVHRTSELVCCIYTIENNMIDIYIYYYYLN